MIELQTIEQLKQAVRITDYLYSKGFTPCNSTGKQFVYRSPLTNEKSASFFVEPELNVFSDFSSGEKGDNIRLVRLIDQVDFVTAIRTLQRLQPYESVPFSLGASKEYILQPDQQRHEITAICPLQHRALVQYLEKRAIPFAMAFNYVKEIHYRLNADGRHYFGIGFETDKGSWAVRSENFKTHIGSQSVTTLETPGSTSINLFEGFFDFLSALVYFRVKTMRNTAIILNTTTNLNKVIDRLKAAQCVYTFLDNDKGGRKALDDIKAAGCTVIDRSTLYADYNDFNERLQAL
ncbi:hypothetical protein G8759_25125 [Spirosoma aureum]|uniref:Zinc finger CHC2-type domain-containing protein n=1 Tax=Spirosoma aureum TaxID=2692134 RepID=A0A6G9ATM7_9BACT|nr:CHC2 zinc finger domain-containing protein [Spirosoma aureum]QIP15679.1 hypothetical protein G8759_25125 [Spirosoma aureum]